MSDGGKNLYARALGHVVAHHQKKQGLTQTELAKAAGKTQATISRVIRGEGHASVWLVRDIAIALGMDNVMELLNDVEDVFKRSDERWQEYEKAKVPDWMKAAAGVAAAGALGFVVGSVIADKYQNDS